MIDFMVIAAPRSGTTWVSNLLTTDTSLCLHDPLYLHDFEDLDQLPHTTNLLGIACTGSMIYADKLNSHSARKLILHREQSEIEASLAQLGMNSAGVQYEPLLNRLEGRHCHWRELFDYTEMSAHFEFLLQKPLSRDRFQLLQHMHIQPDFAAVPYSPEAVKGFLKNLRSI